MLKKLTVLLRELLYYPEPVSELVVDLGVGELQS